MNLTTTTYLTKKQIKILFFPEEDNTIDYHLIAMIDAGCLERVYTYYKPTRKFLRDLGLIPDKVKIYNFNFLAKNSQFLVKDIMDIFNVNKDIAKLILEKYFYKKLPYYGKADNLNELLIEGVEELELWKE